MTDIPPRDSKRTIRSKIRKRLDMVGPKLTAGSNLSELDALSRLAAEYEIELPLWAVIYHRMILAAVRRGYMHGLPKGYRE